MPNDPLHDELLRDLVDSLRSGTRRSQRFVAANANLGSRWGQPGCPRVDVFAMRKSYTQFEIAIYEVKATRGDFNSDAREGKWRSYLPFCHRFYWAAPAGLIGRDEVASEAGLIAWSHKGWYTVVKPPFRPGVDFGFDILLSVLFSCGIEETRNRDLRDRVRAAEWAVGYNEQARSKAFGREVGELVYFAQRAGAEAIIRERDRYRRGFERLCRRLGLRRKVDQEDLLGEGRWTSEKLEEAIASLIAEGDGSEHE